MKKILTSRIFLVVLTAIIVATGSVYATIKIQANEIEYKDGTVEDALNDLYTKSSAYKKIDVSTTASANDILIGKTAYDNLGNLITGTVSTNCVTSYVTHNSNTQFNVDLGFIPTKFFASYHWNSENMNLYLVYDKAISNNIYLNYYEDNGTAKIENYNDKFGFENNHFISNFGGRSFSNQYTFYYMACK